MTKYEDLITKVEKLGIKVRELDFGTTKKSGRCLDNIIYINSNIDEKGKYEILAEEVAHYKKTSGNILNQDITENIKQENIARREAYRILAEPNDVIEAMRHNSTTLDEVAEYLNLSLPTLIDIVNDWKRQYGKGIQVGTCYLQLEPYIAFIRDYGGLFNYKAI